MSLATVWTGPYQSEGQAAYLRAREAGLSPFRAAALGHVGSFKDGWIFRTRLAKIIGCSIRTIGRGLQQGRDLGHIRCARGSKTETPPGASKPITCGFSHRWTMGWGKGGEVVRDAIEAARAEAERRRAARMAAALVQPSPARAHAPDRARGPDRRTGAQKRRWTAEELDAELARTARGSPPDPDSS